MSWLDSLLGRTKLQKPNMDRLFALSTAGPSLGIEAELAPDGRAAVCLRPVEGGEFAQVEQQLRDLVRVACDGKDFHGQVDILQDKLGYQWIVFSDPQLEELVSLVHVAGGELEAQGFGEQLLAAVFRMRHASGAPATPVYLIYNYKRGAFYPFAPIGDRVRDNATEFRVASSLDGTMPMEKDLERWFALWDCPL